MFGVKCQVHASHSSHTVWWCVVQLDAVVAYGRLGGRLDHMFANIDTLYMAAREAPGVPVYLVDEENIACLLNKVYVI